jgi:hypothetical protein
MKELDTYMKVNQHEQEREGDNGAVRLPGECSSLLYPRYKSYSCTGTAVNDDEISNDDKNMYETHI